MSFPAFSTSTFELMTGSKLNSLVLGDGKNPTFNDGNPGILISWGPINPYGIGLMSLSPIIWKCHGSWSTRSHIWTRWDAQGISSKGFDFSSPEKQKTCHLKINGWFRCKFLLKNSPILGNICFFFFFSGVYSQTHTICILKNLKVGWKLFTCAGDQIRHTTLWPLRGV